MLARLALLVLLLLAPLRSGAQAADDNEEGRSIIVALAERPQAAPAVGGTPRASYGAGYGYVASLGTQALADALAADYGLQREGAWTIAPLKLFCLQFRLPAGADAAQTLAALARDPRVQLAQPLNRFETLTDAPAYNDPYVGLQRGFAAMDVAQAQRWSRGDGVRVALIDTGLDASHPDLQGRIAAQRDFAGAAHPPPAEGQAERHGTQMAGVIAAAANNGLGIVGVAPRAQLLAYRACWEMGAKMGATARCNSFTLAQALGAAIAAGADVINLSLGGPPDPLLARLTEHAIKRGIVVVGATPPGGSRAGFPVGVEGVLAVRSSDEASGDPGIAAPGRDILTLSPGGGYDYASGSSLAAAQITGAVALLRALSPGLSGAQAQAWLAAGRPVASSCEAVRRLRSQASCAAPLPAAE